MANDSGWGNLGAFGQLQANAAQAPPSSSSSTDEMASLLTHPKQEEAEAKRYQQEQASKKSNAEELAAQKAEVKAIESSPWTQLGNALVQQYQQAEVPAQQLMSGAENAPATSGAINEALSSLGLGAGSSGAQWLNQMAGQAAAVDAPVQQAMNQQGAAYAAEAGPISKAVAAYGQANALGDITAPEASWLNALASHVTSNLSYYGELPSADVGVLQSSPGLVQALTQAGGYAAGSSGSGLIPLNDLSVQGGQVKVKNTNSGVGNQGAVAGTGNVPAPSAAPS